MDVEQYIVDHFQPPYSEFIDEIKEMFGVELSRHQIRRVLKGSLLRGSNMKRNPSPKRDTEVFRLKSQKSEAEKRSKAMVSEVAKLQDELEALKSIPEVSTFVIKPLRRSHLGEAVAVVVASDWHIEEPVKPEQVSGLNEYNLTVAEARVREFFQASLRLTEICGRDIKIQTMVLALLGDFISGSIHDELMESNQLSPIDAIIRVEGWIASGIEFLLANSELKLIIPCHSGNHARITKKQRHATEEGNSLERFMYHHLAEHFSGNERVKFLISPSYHSYVDVLGLTVRFHHGHDLRYQGGVGGLTIPVNKAIAQWNKGRWAHLDVFGHWHTRLDGKNFLSNGSVIGYNAYAIAIKADYEKPSQTFFLIDKKRGRTCVWPIYFSV